MDNKLPLISIILPIYNVEPFLERCVESLLKQTYKNIEIILVDDASPDRCPEICDRYAESYNNIKVVHRENGGPSAARNSGINVAEGALLSFVDPDDYVTEDFIEFLYNVMVKNDADISACGVIECYPSGKTRVMESDTSLHVIGPKEALERICYNDGLYITTWDKLYKKSLFDDIRFPEGKLFEDTGITYRLLYKAQRTAFKGEPKYYYMISPNQTSITTSKFTMKKLDYVEMADEMASFIIDKYPELAPAAERKQLHACFSTLTQLVNSRTRNKGVEKYLTDRINALRSPALKNPRTPKRDKLAILSLGLGFGFFSFVWRIYLKIKKG